MLCHVSGWYEFDWREESSTAVNAIHTKEDDAGKIFTVKRDQQGTFLCLHSCCFWATICKTVCPSAIGPLSVCLSCNVGILRPNSWMDQDVTWHGGRPWPRRHCVKTGSQLPLKGAQPPPSFRFMSIVAGRMDEDANWYRSRPRPRPHCVRQGPSSPYPWKVAQQPLPCRPMSIVATVAHLSATAELLYLILYDLSIVFFHAVLCHHYSGLGYHRRIHNNIGSWPSDHYFRSVCLSACLCRVFSAVFDPISIKPGDILYVWV